MYKIHFVDFLQQNFNPRIIVPMAWHISSSLLSAVSLLFACGMQVNININPQKTKLNQVIFKFSILYTEKKKKVISTY